jgi:hypothetical protein
MTVDGLPAEPIDRPPFSALFSLCLFVAFVIECASQLRSKPPVKTLALIALLALAGCGSKPSFDPFWTATVEKAK